MILKQYPIQIETQTSPGQIAISGDLLVEMIVEMVNIDRVSLGVTSENNSEKVN